MCEALSSTLIAPGLLYVTSAHVTADFRMVGALSLFVVGSTLLLLLLLLLEAAESAAAAPGSGCPPSPPNANPSTLNYTQPVCAGSYLEGRLLSLIIDQWPVEG